MDRIRKTFRRRESYEPLEGGSVRPDGERIDGDDKQPFNWIDYNVFFLLGISMLWAWNMFLAAGPYFQKRFASSESILSTFQSAELSVSTICNLGSTLILAKLQRNASYPRRVISSLGINIIAFTLLTISTRVATGISAQAYFGFLIVMVAAASLATGLCQNGVFAYATGFGREEYTQAIMTGQAVAGVLPCIAQIVSVLAVPADKSNEQRNRIREDMKSNEDGSPEGSSKSAFAYFLTATCVSALALVAFFYLLSRHPHIHRRKRSSVANTLARPSTADVAAVSSSNSVGAEDVDEGIDDAEDEETASEPEHKSIPLTTLFRKLHWLCVAVFLTFGITMIFPVFTQQISSVRDEARSPRIFERSAFIPLAFLLWNIGDLIGRLLTAVPALSLTRRPFVLFLLSIARVVFIPLYLLCNIRGDGTAVIPSDAFYLIVVQLLFGLTNGYVGSQCMMGAVDWVDVPEREAAGGFMGMCLVAGLTVGSLASFFVGAT
ncbi:nucleoside transporter family [Lineolata rhizophorae]|uniref:Nucleoside transporter family n=1 Tax=Lineolata rhizophorae TaxID=578093 RepID=A0A6A6NXR3_9PEZI|nr:nucleoside transporter family [Lineolata rhizophorae]